MLREAVRSREYADWITAYCLLPTPYWNSAALKRPHPPVRGSTTSTHFAKKSLSESLRAGHDLGKNPLHPSEALEAVRSQQMIHIGQHRLHSPAKRPVFRVSGQRIQPDHRVHLSGESLHFPLEQVSSPQVPSIAHDDHHGPLVEMLLPGPRNCFNDSPIRVPPDQSGTSLEILLRAFSTGSLRTKKVIRVREVENT